MRTKSNDSYNRTEPIDSELFNDSVSALKSLGFTAKTAKEKVTQILNDNPGLEVEEVVKLALKKS
jgi:Holliday junction resolvasome RuvABC DNA-binding subunit